MTRTCAAQRGGDLEVAIKRSLGKLVSQALTEGVQLVSDGLRLKPLRRVTGLLPARVTCRRSAAKRAERLPAAGA